MDITAIAAAIPYMNLGNQIAASVMKMSLNQLETAGDGIKKMMEMSVTPNLGGNIDISL
ncbi:YjfB family protein [[Clostridium] polysaccharolyticum]|uniref:Putative motility protein n=1 Tax=[Clostridium] polysaccharolyticum TaxID=29364 RepID=A0A1I0DLP2_9FIRM|nr:YjfB family protein [[Clostridium] polysaccharolyticum]SET33269.1 Putative motility protein [[Clostridium] polysaccharolyticum]